MALWKVDRLRNRTAVIYVNLRTGQRFDCGDQESDTPVRLITDWISEHGDPGDMVAVDGRVCLVIQKPANG